MYFVGQTSQWWRFRERVGERNVAFSLRRASLPREKTGVLKITIFVEQLTVPCVEFANAQRLAARLAQVGHVAMHLAL